MRKIVPAVALAFALGLVVGAVGFGGGLAPPHTGPDPKSPPYGVSTAGPNCLDVRPNAGWVYEAAAGDAYTVSLNATVVHQRGQRISTNVTRVSPGRYRISLRTVPAATPDGNRTKSPPEGCRVATDVLVGTSLPTDYREFEVTVNGRTLRTVENEDTTADLYRLPNPVNATASAR